MRIDYCNKIAISTTVNWFEVEIGSKTWGGEGELGFYDTCCTCSNQNWVGRFQVNPPNFFTFKINQYNYIQSVVTNLEGVSLGIFNEAVQ